MQEPFRGNGPWSAAGQASIFAYCEGVRAGLERLLQAMGSGCTVRSLPLIIVGMGTE
jgi:hypothetical protein